MSECFNFQLKREICASMKSLTINKAEQSFCANERRRNKTNFPFVVDSDSEEEKIEQIFPILVSSEFDLLNKISAVQPAE
jgi:hypothetical protein